MIGLIVGIIITGVWSSIGYAQYRGHGVHFGHEPLFKACAYAHKRRKDGIPVGRFSRMVADRWCLPTTTIRWQRFG